jgi:hypothetical protein
MTTQRRNDAQGAKRRATPAKRKRKAKGTSRRFWGEGLPDASAEAPLRVTPDPTAVVRSLGIPPLPGQEHASGLYFQTVYERSVRMAAALAAAGDLIEVDEAVDAVEGQS